jgi:hypothetical protein
MDNELYIISLKSISGSIIPIECTELTQKIGCIMGMKTRLPRAVPQPLF